MKKQVLLSFVLSCSFTALLMFGCGPSKEEMEARERSGNGTIKETHIGGYDILTIDGCEYISCSRNYNILTHKGNCPNHENQLTK
jgi:hypothetical protein